MSVWPSVRNYIEVTKPRTVLLLAFTALGAMIVASGRDIVPVVLLLASLAVVLGSSGANALTCYIDRDIDAVMLRTKFRPLPSGRIAPPEKALFYGLILAALSIVLAYLLSPLSSLFMLLGILDNVIIYSKFLKRRNPFNIIIGGFSGGLPALVGYAAVTNTVTSEAILIGALVVLWIPTHIWSLALRYKEDYARANVPMLPVVVHEKTAIRCIATTSILMVLFSILLYFLGALGWIYLSIAAGSGAAMLLLNSWLITEPTKDKAWVVFKFSSPYLALLFSGMMLDTIIL